MSVFTDEFLFMNLYYGLNFPAYLVALSWITDTVNVCMISLIQLEFCVYLTRCWEGLFYSFFFPAWISNCHCIIYWDDIHFPHDSIALCCNLNIHTCVIFFWSLLSIPLICFPFLFPIPCDFNYLTCSFT